jgi:flavodoxin short chain
MSKIAIVFWSGTGNTQAMAEAVLAGAKEAGAQADLLNADEFSAAKVAEYDAIGFGCPSMGVEQLEESSFEPMFAACESALNGKRIALFGSFGWGDGQWMRDWESRCEDAGARMICDSVICNETPNDDGLNSCRELGASLAKA